MINKDNLKTKLHEEFGMPLFIYGSDIDFINNTCCEFFDEFNVVEKIKSELNSVNEVRDLIVFLNATPIYAQTKLVLLTNAQKWSKNVKSALLKNLEEYPDYNKIMITSSALLDLTIMSRCYSMHVVSDASYKLCDERDIREVEDPHVLFVWAKNLLERLMRNEDMKLLVYVEDLWDKTNETYAWFRKGEISLQNCTQIMSGLIKDYLNQTNNS